MFIYFALRNTVIFIIKWIVIMNIYLIFMYFFIGKENRLINIKNDFFE